MPWNKSSPGGFAPSYRTAMIEAWVNGESLVPLQKDNRYWQAEFSRFKFCIRHHPAFDAELTRIERGGMFRCKVNPENYRITVYCRVSTISWLESVHPDLMADIALETI